jgi:thiosulfate reductase cytochrome b subunit
VYRHRLPTRLAHWIIVLCLPILVMSGFQIFNAHPALYWGDRSDPEHALVALENGFPSWATLPGEHWLAMGRRWHFFFAWIFVVTGIAFGIYAVVSRHLTGDLWPGIDDLRGIGRSIVDHLRFHHPSGDAAARYNVMQKLAYVTVVFGFGPLIVLTGLAMSPRFDATLPFLVRILGGRQSARTLHFLLTFAFLGFTLSHLFMVAVTGIVNNVRSMVTGRYQIIDQEPGRGD